MSDLHTYDSNQVVVTVGGVPVESGRADGDFVTVERVTPELFTSSVGADGEETHSKTNDNRYTVTITLTQASRANDLFSGLRVLDDKTDGNTGAVPISVRDRNGTTVFTSPQARITKEPNIVQGKEAGEREWVFNASNGSRFIGGLNGGGLLGTINAVL